MSNINEILIQALNVSAMLGMVLFAMYLSAVLHDQEIKLFTRIIVSICKMNLKPIRDLKGKTVYLWCYPVITMLLGQAIMVARQFKIGKMYIRTDYNFIIGAILWIALPMLFIGLNKRYKKNK